MKRADRKEHARLKEQVLGAALDYARELDHPLPDLLYRHSLGQWLIDARRQLIDFELRLDSRDRVA